MSGSKDGTVRVWGRSNGSWDQVVCNARTRVVTDRDPKEQIDVLFSQVNKEDSRSTFSRMTQNSSDITHLETHAC